MRWRAENSPFASEMRFGHVGRRPYMILSRPDGLVLVAPNFTFEHEEAWVRLLFLACFLSAIFFITYIGLRRIFRPLHLLSAGVKQVASGNLDVQIQVNSHDELGHLSQAFNQMTSEVKKNLHSKEQLLYNVSHELRSPLTRIKLSLEFLPPSKRRDEIGEEVDQMEAMIDELLESARLESAYGVLAKQRVELGLLLSDLAHKETHPVQIKQTEPIFIQADPRRLERLLSNLIGNAVKHSPQEVPVEVSLSQSGLEVKISIEDQGPGIPEEDRPFLFEPFYRVDKSRNQRTGGYGLGLSLAQQIAEAHGGQITIEEKPTPGSRFVLRLPV
ncbi:MAG: hypothetical protein A2508_05705 [Candidatus Lambdaproteobacteria bacterium RIFOXYD12_FULL_49_8]|nr:MAG: hypothetical protein A2508_05705 [Candidatus Lambdaproteobacteria bacterium RIFOXYD12_FULL_49_8]